MRLTQTKANGTAESLFYDPWYQRCFTTTPAQPKIFPAEHLELEISQLIKQTPMIAPTLTLYDLEQSQQIKNDSDDFSYFIVCSSREFATPALPQPDPSRAQPDPDTTSWYNSCSIS